MNYNSIVNYNDIVEQKYIDLLMNVAEAMTVDIENEDILRNAYNINFIDTWQKTIPTLTDEQLLGVFKGIVIAEKHFKWGVDSAALGAWLYNEISERKIDLDLKLANWAYLYTDNPYVPFGSAGNIRHQSKDAYEYIANTYNSSYINLSDDAKEKIRISRSTSSYLENRTSNELFEENAILQRKVSRLEDEVLKLTLEKQRLKERLVLASKPNAEKAQFIIEDTINPVYYYSNEIIGLLCDRNVPVDLLKQILIKFLPNENEHNNKLKNKIIEEINNRE